MQRLKRLIWRLKGIAFHRYRRSDNKLLGQPAPLRIARIASFDEYGDYARSMASEYERRRLTEQALHAAQECFYVPGFCFVCGRPVSFWADCANGFTADGQFVPNWRECLICQGCRLNNRMRAAIHLFYELCHPLPDCNVYITEQTTPMYGWLKRVFANVVGSEFLELNGSAEIKTTKGIRHEDLTRLSFADGQFDFVLSFDVFEHIPDYRKAFRECRRVLKKAAACSSAFLSIGILPETSPWLRYCRTESRIIFCRRSIMVIRCEKAGAFAFVISDGNAWMN